MLSNRQLEVVRPYVYLGVPFKACLGKFLMTQATKYRLTRGYASLSIRETMLPHLLPRATNKGVAL